jgi:hypothetical protein
VKPRSRWLAALVGVALLAAWALPLFAPPAAQPLVPPPGDASLLERLFPGVPPAWVLLRLAALAAGAVLLAATAPMAPVIALAPPAPPAPVRTSFALAALALAGALALVSGFGASRLSRPGQPLFLALLLGPALLLALGARRRGPPQAAMPRRRRPELLAAAGVTALWAATRLPLAWRSPRSASLTDLWQGFGWLVDAAAYGRNVLVETGQPGVAKSWMLLVGISLMGPGRFSPSLPWLQVVDVLYLAAGALGVGFLASRCLAPWSAPAASAVFLASPFVSMMSCSASPFGVFLGLAVAVVFCLLAFHERRSAASLALLAAVGGLASMTAYLANVVLASGLVAAGILALRRPRPLWLHWGIPLLVFLAAALPSLPGPATLGEMSERYVDLHGEWVSLEAMLFGQRSPYDPPLLERVWTAGTPGPFDIALGSLLSPFAVPRTPLRLWADALFEPVGGALAAVGLAACLRFARRESGARGLLVLLAVTLLPATVSSAYDRASLTRNLALPLAVALLAAVGLELVRAQLLPRVRPGALALGAALAALAGGVTLFDVVGPRILPSAALEIQVEAVGRRPPPGGALLLDYGRPRAFEWMHVAPIGAFLPPHPIPARLYTGPESLRNGAGEPAAEVLLFSPALDRDQIVVRAICRAWPAAALYSMKDRLGFSEAFAARPAGPGWEPDLPRERWAAASCPVSEAGGANPTRSGAGSQ